MKNDPVISLHHVAKAFRFSLRKDATVLSRIAGIVSREEKVPIAREIHAVSDVSFDVASGEVLGVIGRNAAGKSTLLRLIAGILQPDTGTVEVHGTVTSLINLGVGLRNRLTVRDNIFLACSLLGMSHREIEQALPSILEFAEIEEYLHSYPYQLSAGTVQRLTFSIAVHTKPEILLLDEVFSVGDLVFTEKSKTKIRDLIRSDITVVLTSHDMEKIRQLCDRVLWLEKGVVRAYGDVQEVTKEYQNYCLNLRKIVATV